MKDTQDFWREFFNTDYLTKEKWAHPDEWQQHRDENCECAKFHWEQKWLYNGVTVGYYIPKT